MKKKILFTGLSGFVGQNFLHFFKLKESFEVIPFDRNKPIDSQLNNIDIIIHSAGLAHNPQITDRESYIRANSELTTELCNAALQNSVKTFIYLSTIKVLGEYNDSKNYFDNDSPYNPKDFYSESKVLAEKFLLDHFKQGLIILRPVLIYGPGMKGNMRTLEKFSKLPLPLKSIKAKRSIIFVGNLVRIIESYLNTNEGQVVKNCADKTPLTVGEIITKINTAKNQMNKTFNFPETIILFVLRLFKLDSFIDRLMRDFIVKVDNKSIDLYSEEEAFQITFKEKKS